ncbi:MAG: anti-sigma F factor [Lachnospiraceae bacterium]
MYKNKMHLEFESKSENEKFARVTVAAFATRLNPILEELADLKTAVSEAVTNAIVHGYDEGEGIVYLDCIIEDNVVTVIVEDKGVGIPDVEKAKEPLYTTKPEQDRSGMGFMFMEVFMDEVYIESKVGEGTTVIMKKKIGEV